MTEILLIIVLCLLVINMVLLIRSKDNPAQREHLEMFLKEEMRMNREELGRISVNSEEN